MNTIKEPDQRLHKDVVKVMYIASILWMLVQAIVLALAFYLYYYFDWPKWVFIGLIIVTVIAIINKVVDLILPMLRYRNWRYRADEAYLYLKRGAIFESRTIVPMTKIQSVSTSQGPLLRRYKLYDIEVATMGTAHTIPGLPKDTAFQLRDDIATYAKIKEEEA
ncbi:MAG TPA: PH domain-containing protein [Pseudogracilibacillus sp.]|nr:PH domain-containing protein [Pseudogracilibacillus sp.]